MLSKKNLHLSSTNKNHNIMKTLIITPMKKVSTILRHVFITRDANEVELAQVALPIIIVAVALLMIFGYHPKY